MAHSINGIITSFKYKGELPNIVLVGNYCLIPFNNKYKPNYSELVLQPYEEFTKGTRKILKDLSFKGKCVYIETDYFGGSGTQMSEAWYNGKKIIGPFLSFDGIEDYKIISGTTLVEDAINETLKIIDVYKHEDKDEFDSIRLGMYRSNEDIFDEYKRMYDLAKENKKGLK